MSRIARRTGQLLVALGWMLLASLSEVSGLQVKVTDEGPLDALAEATLVWAREVASTGTERQRLARLSAALIRRGWQEDSDLTLDANAAFERRAGNCVSFAFLLAGLARSRGVPAVFVVRGPESSELRGDLEIDRSHLAVGLETHGELLVYDLSGSHQGSSDYRRVSDEEALGVFYSNQGAALLLEGKEREAVDVLKEATETAPALASAWLNLGVALLRSQEIDGAEAAYRRAVVLEPGSVSAWRNLALLLERRTQETKKQ